MNGGYSGYGGRSHLWIWLVSTVGGGFFLWLTARLVGDALKFYTDPSYKNLRQTQEDTLATQVPIREQILTYALIALIALILLGVALLIFTFVRYWWRKADLVIPTEHGLPAVWGDKAHIRVIDQPAQTQANMLALGAGHLPAIVRVYDQPLPALAFALGVRGDGRQITTPFFGDGCLVVAGNSGAGKSELIASLVAQAGRLWHDSGNRGQYPVEVVLFDPKGDDFARLPQAPWMPYPIVSGPAECQDLLGQLVADAKQRSKEMQQLSVNSLENAWQLGMRWAVRWVLVDELSLLTVQQSKGFRDKFEKGLEELAARGRSRGYRLVVATQRLHSDTLTRRVSGIRAAAVAFATATEIESRLILDEPGAERLPPEYKGRMLYKQGVVIEGQALYADLKSQFPTWYETLIQQAQQSQLALGAGVQPPPGLFQVPVQLSAGGVWQPVQPAYDTSAAAPETDPSKGAVAAYHSIDSSNSSIESVVSQAEAGAAVGAPAAAGEAVPYDQPPRHERDERIIYRAVERLGSIQAAQRALYRNTAGGKRYYWVRGAWNREKQRRGLEYNPAHLGYTRAASEPAEQAAGASSSEAD